MGNDEQLDQVLGRLEAINPEDLRRTLQCNQSPELNARLHLVREKTAVILAELDQIIEGDFRTAPRLQPITAIVPVEPETPAPIERHQNSTEASEKLDTIGKIEDEKLKNLLRQKAGQLSIKALKILAKLDYLFCDLNKLDYPPDSGYGLDFLVNQIYEILGLLIDNVRPVANPYALGGWDPQVKGLQPYITFIHDQLSGNIEPYYVSHYSTHKYPQKIKNYAKLVSQFSFMAKLFGLGETLFESTVARKDWLSFIRDGEETPLALFLANSHEFWEKEQADPELQKEKLLILAPTFRDMKTWSSTVMSAEQRHKQILTLMRSMDEEDLRSLDTATCESFLMFLSEKDAVKIFLQSTYEQRHAFIRNGDHTFPALLAINQH